MQIKVQPCNYFLKPLLAKGLRQTELYRSALKGILSTLSCWSDVLEEVYLTLPHTSDQPTAGCPFTQTAWWPEAGGGGLRNFHHCFHCRAGRSTSKGRLRDCKSEVCTIAARQHPCTCKSIRLYVTDGSLNSEKKWMLKNTILHSLSQLVLFCPKCFLCSIKSAICELVNKENYRCLFVHANITERHSGLVESKNKLASSQ